jgi:RNA polymerase sigma-70 factor (ECF subfamily)
MIMEQQLEEKPVSGEEQGSSKEELEFARTLPPEEWDDATRLEYNRLFETEMVPHLKALYHFAYRFTNDEDDANDLVQETYLKAYRFISSYARGSNAKAWLFRILRNSFINSYRKTSREPAKVDYEEAETFLNTGKATFVDSIDAQEKIFRSMIGDEVTMAVNSLPVDFRTVIILCDIEGFTYEEIAEIVDIPIGTVRSRLHRARKILKDQLLKYALSMGYRAD